VAAPAMGLSEMSSQRSSSEWLSAIVTHAAAAGSAAAAVVVGLLLSAAILFARFSRDGLPEPAPVMGSSDWVLVVLVVLGPAAMGTAVVAVMLGRRRLWTVLGTALAVILATVLFVTVLNTPDVPVAARPMP